MLEVGCSLGELVTGLNVSVPSEAPLMARVITRLTRGIK